MIIHSFRFLHVHRLAAADVLPAHRAFVNPFRALPGRLNGRRVRTGRPRAGEGRGDVVEVEGFGGGEGGGEGGKGLFDAEEGVLRTTAG
jgi:hypothetical protein